MDGVPIQVAIGVGWFSEYRDMYGGVKIGRTFGIQEWNTTITDGSFHGEFNVGIHWI